MKISRKNFLFCERASTIDSTKVQCYGIRQKCQKPWYHSIPNSVNEKTRKQTVSDGLLRASKELFNQTVLDRRRSENPCTTLVLSRLDCGNCPLAGVSDCLPKKQIERNRFELSVNCIGVIREKHSNCLKRHVR